MIQAVIEGISRAIYEEFGDNYSIYDEEIKQGLKEPCFIISCVRTSHITEMRSLYTQNNPFWVQFIPKVNGQEKRECQAAAERLESCLKYITADGDMIRGTDIHHETVDGVLTFSVTYKIRLIGQSGQPKDEMGALNSSVNLKG